MNTTLHLQPAKPVTAFNAIDRFEMVRTVLADCQRWLVPLEQCAHPALFDLFVNYRLLVATVEESANKFTSARLKTLTNRDFMALNKLESLVAGFQDTLKDAHAELVNHGVRYD